MTEAHVRVGTCGFAYDHWRGRFYPERLPAARRLEYYRERFSAIELDVTFYRLPSEVTIAAWAHAAAGSPGFRFALKGIRLITHLQRLAGAEQALETYLARVAPLGPALAFVLWQLPPGLELDLPRLDAFLGRLPSRPRQAVEFRHRSWLTRATYRLLERRGVATCWVSSPAMPADSTITADFVALRLHGLAGGYSHRYTDAELAPWVERLRAAADGGREAYAFFNNDGLAHAPADAARLIGLLGTAAEPWPVGPARSSEPDPSHAPGVTGPTRERPPGDGQPG